MITRCRQCNIDAVSGFTDVGSNETIDAMSRIVDARRLTTRLLAACVLIVVVVLAGIEQPAAAALRCGTRLVSLGDHKLEVLNKCGEPTLIEPLGYGHYTYWPHHSHRLHGHYTAFAQLEEWTYNFGPRRFMRLVRFADGKVVRIISLDYGY